ncbi:MAG: PAS domain S-box protein [Methanoregula sp.]|nr:PAS domain S-box protein [Methanoregula sp.]
MVYSVLYVDDEPVLLELGKTFLELSGSLTVETATSADEAIEFLKTRTVDCIISDYQMPLTDGIAFLKHIRSHMGLLPFILFTGRGREEVVIEAFSHAADFYLQKGGDPKAQFVELEHKVKLAIERRRNQDELKESRQRMADIIDHLPDATFAIDLEHRVIAWNFAMEEMTGTKKDEVLGSVDQSYAIPFYGIKRPLLLDLILKDDPEIAKKYPSITRKGSKLISELFIPLLYDGKGAYLWFIASPLYDSNGHVTGAIESIRDVTGSHTAKDELMASQERYRAVVEDQTEFISRFLPDGTHIFVNEAYCRYFEKTAQEIIGTRFKPGLFSEDRKIIRDHLLSLTPGNPERAIEHRIIMPGGLIRWQQWSDRAIFDDQGKIREYQSVGRDVTDQKRAEDELRRAYEEITATGEEMRAQFEELRMNEEALRESERKLQGIVRGSPIPQFVIDKNHRVISWNHALEEYSGIRAADILGTTDPWMAFYNKKRPVLADLIIDNSLDKIDEWYAGKYARSRYVEGGFEATDFFPHMGETGKWLFFTASAIRDSEGSIIGAVETLEDVTDIKQQEEALRTSEEKYRTILEDMQDTYYRSDKAGNLIMISPSGVSLLGYDSVEEMLGRSIAATFYYDPLQRDRFLDAIARDGFVTNLETLLKRKDGSMITVSTNSHKYFDRNGTFLGVEGTFRDITCQRQSEEAQLKSEERYRALFENTGTAMVLLEEDTVISIANAEFVHLSGYSPEEIEGKMRWTQLVVKEDLERMLSQHRLRRERHEEALRNYDFRFVTKVGDIRNIFLTIDLIPGTKQSVASLMDITDKVQAQEALKLANRKLNLLNSITRHDILNQLTSLLGFLGLVQEKVTDPTLLSYIEREQKAAEAIRSHIEFTRDYQDVGVRAPEWQRVESLIGPAAATINLKEIVLTIDVKDAEVYADRLLQQVFYTLIENATRHGGQVTKIRFSCKESPHGLIITCEDDGSGVPDDAKEKIFQRKYYQNTGLGLFLSQEILSITGMVMHETGVPGKCARFEIAVPNGAYRFGNGPASG